MEFSYFLQLGAFLSNTFWLLTWLLYLSLLQQNINFYFPFRELVVLPRVKDGIRKSMSCGHALYYTLHHRESFPGQRKDPRLFPRGLAWIEVDVSGLHHLCPRIFQISWVCRGMFNEPHMGGMSLNSIKITQMC